MRRRLSLAVQLRFLASAFDGATIRRTLLFGFGAIFVLWLVSAYELARRLAELESRAAAISSRFTQGEELLFTVRAQVLLGSVYLRDAFLETGPKAATFYREQLQNTRAEIERALQGYVPDVDSDIEREQWTRLEGEFHDYWNAMFPVLESGMARSPAEAQALLRQDVIPKRETIIRISNRIRTLNHAAFQQQQAEVARLHRALRTRVWWTSGILVALGLGVAFVATRYAGRLESRIRRQHLQELRHKRDLQRLSAKLVHAQEEERRAIARDLHDEIGQALTAIKMELAVLERSLNPSGAGIHALAEALSTTDRTLQTVRDLSQLLHPAMLDDLGLPDTLNSYLRSFSHRTAIRTDLVQDRMNERIASDLEVCVYRIVQEALTNVARHAQATSCRVYLQRLPFSILVTVEDDGKGMDPERATGTEAQRGLGLMGIRERVAGFGGTVCVESQIGKGTRLTVELPVPSRVNEESLRATERETDSPGLPEGVTLDGQATPLAG